MKNFGQQFFEKRLGFVVLGLIATHLAAAVTQDSVWSWLPLGVITVLALYLSYRKLEWGLALALLEIFVGGHGHLIDVSLSGFSLSIREVLFAVVMTVWVIQVAQGRVRPKFVAHRDLSLLALGVAVAIATVIGFLQNPAGSAFDDMNGYFTLLYFFPFISITWTNDNRRLFLQMFAVAAAWVGMTTLVYLYAFTHLPGLASHVLYTFVRDARLAEVTLLTSGRGIQLLGNSPWYFRIFEQSQAISVAFELLLLAATFFLWKEPQEKLPKGLWVMHALLIATILASLSRSFWMGSAAAFGLIILLLCLSRPKVFTLIKRHAQLGIVTLIAVLTLFVLVAAPLPPRPDLSESSFYKGKDDNTRGVAVSSRWNLLGPMVSEIKAHPLLGSGFGEEVTYISDDPRLRAIDPTGEVTTYRFEWGYHDIWLKMGLLGLFGFGWFFVTVVSVAFEAVVRRDAQAWITVGLTAGLVMLFVTNIFSPYLNHPIGLGYMLFLLPFLPWEVVRAPEAAADSVQRQSFSLKAAAPSVAYKQN